MSPQWTLVFSRTTIVWRDQADPQLLHFSIWEGAKEAAVTCSGGQGLVLVPALLWSPYCLGEWKAKSLQQLQELGWSHCCRHGKGSH